MRHQDPSRERRQRYPLQRDVPSQEEHPLSFSPCVPSNRQLLNRDERYRDIQKYVAHIDAEHEQRFRQQIEDTEKKMRQQKEDVIHQSDSIANQIAQELANKLTQTKRKIAK